MSTTNISSWAMDLGEVGAIYPFQGAEGMMVIATVIAWLVWHIWQLAAEQKKNRREQHRFRDEEFMKRALEEDE